MLSSIISFLVTLAIFGVLLAFPAMWLCNGTLVEVFDGVKEINAWQGLGLALLGRILFGSSG